MQASKIDLTIPKFTKDFQRGKEVTFFVIKLKYEGQKWELKRRYKEFAELKKDLAANHGGLPSMPGKTLWKMKGADFLEKRRVGL